MAHRAEGEERRKRSLVGSESVSRRRDGVSMGDRAAHLQGSCPRRSLGRHGYTVEMRSPGAKQSIAVRAMPALPGGEGRAAERTKWMSPSCSRLPAGKRTSEAGAVFI